MKKFGIYAGLAAVAAAALAVGSFATAGSGKKVVKADLESYLEVPAISTGGTGSLAAMLDDGADTISYTLSYSGLEGAGTLFAHIHFGQRSVNGGVAAFLCGGGGKPACPAGSGTVTGVIGAPDVIGPGGQGISSSEIGELFAAIRAGRAYANVHTTTFPGGEIRGQINDDNQRDD